jgi:hypothetical protein
MDQEFGPYFLCLTKSEFSGVRKWYNMGKEMTVLAELMGVQEGIHVIVMFKQNFLPKGREPMKKTNFVG